MIEIIKDTFATILYALMFLPLAVYIIFIILSLEKSLKRIEKKLEVKKDSIQNKKTPWFKKLFKGVASSLGFYVE